MGSFPCLFLKGSPSNGYALTDFVPKSSSKACLPFNNTRKPPQNHHSHCTSASTEDDYKEMPLINPSAQDLVRATPGEEVVGVQHVLQVRADGGPAGGDGRLATAINFRAAGRPHRGGESGWPPSQ